MQTRRPTPTRLILAAIAVPACVLLAAACGRAPDPDPTPAMETSRQHRAERSQPPQPRSGGEFRLPLAGVTTLDPAASSNVNEGLAVHQIFQGLVRFDWRLRVVPDLATAWTTSSDRCTYTFELDPDARFHDGKPVTSADVVYSFRRVLDPATESLARFSLADIIDDGPDAIQALGPHRCSIKIREPDHVFIKLLAIQQTKIVPQHAADLDSFRHNPIGSGPFRMAHRRANRIILEAHRREGSETPYLDQIVLLDLDAAEERNALENRHIDYVVVSPGDNEHADALEDFELTTITPLSVHFLGINVTRPPFDDRRVRQAIACAVDQKSLEEATNGKIIAADSILPPGVPGHVTPEPLYPSDRERALELLRTAGYGEGGERFPEVQVLFGKIPLRPDIVDRLRRNFAAVGIDMKARIVNSYSDYMANLFHVDMVVIGWGADYPDPDSFLHNLFRTDAPQNAMGYSSEDVDELLEMARHAAKGKVERTMMYRKVVEILATDCPAVPLFYDAALHCMDKKVRGLTPNPMGIYTTRLDEVWIAAEEH